MPSDVVATIIIVSTIIVLAAIGLIIFTNSLINAQAELEYTQLNSLMVNLVTDLDINLLNVGTVRTYPIGQFRVVTTNVYSNEVEYTIECGYRSITLNSSVITVDAGLSYPPNYTQFITGSDSSIALGTESMIVIAEVGYGVYDKLRSGLIIYPRPLIITNHETYVYWINLKLKESSGRNVIKTNITKYSVEKLCDNSTHIRVTIVKHPLLNPTFFEVSSRGPVYVVESIVEVSLK